MDNPSAVAESRAEDTSSVAEAARGTGLDDLAAALPLLVGLEEQ